MSERRGNRSDRLQIPPDSACSPDIARWSARKHDREGTESALIKGAAAILEVNEAGKVEVAIEGKENSDLLFLFNPLTDATGSWKNAWRQQCLDGRQFLRMLMPGIALSAQGTGALCRLEVEFENALISFVGDV
jgi:hypothetical protein